MQHQFNDARRRESAKTAQARRRRHALTDAQLDQLTEALGTQRGKHAAALRTMVEVMLASGARAHELAYAHWEDFDPATGALALASNPCEYDRAANLPLAAWQALTKLQESPIRGRPVFPNLFALRMAFSRCVCKLDMPGIVLGQIRDVARTRFAKADAAPAAATPSEIATLPPAWLDALLAARRVPDSPTH